MLKTPSRPDVGAFTVSSFVPEVTTAMWDCFVEEFLLCLRQKCGGLREWWTFPLCCLRSMLLSKALITQVARSALFIPIGHITGRLCYSCSLKNGKKGRISMWTFTTSFSWSSTDWRNQASGVQRCSLQSSSLLLFHFTETHVSWNCAIIIHQCNSLICFSFMSDFSILI